MRIAICDDETVQLEYLSKMITDFSHSNKQEVTIKTFSSAEQMLFEIGDFIPFDLVLLDIQMGQMNGMELAKKIRTIDEHVSIVFLTGVKDYVFEGYEVGALRYLLKPLKEKELIKILTDISHSLKGNEIQYFIFSFNGEMVKIRYDDILFIESFGHYIEIHTFNETYRLKKSISEILKELNSPLFLPVHRSYVVNLNHVERILKDSCVLSNQKQINVSRSHYKHLNEAFIKYYKGVT